MSEMEVKEKSDRICQNIISSNLFQQAERILAYAPLGNEVDIRPVIEEGWRQQKRIVFPKVFGDTVWDMAKATMTGFLKEKQIV